MVPARGAVGGCRARRPQSFESCRAVGCRFRQTASFASSPDMHGDPYRRAVSEYPPFEPDTMPDRPGADGPPDERDQTHEFCSALCNFGSRSVTSGQVPTHLLSPGHRATGERGDSRHERGGESPVRLQDTSRVDSRSGPCGRQFHRRHRPGRARSVAGREGRRPAGQGQGGCPDHRLRGLHGRHHRDGRRRRLRGRSGDRQLCLRAGVRRRLREGLAVRERRRHLRHDADPQTGQPGAVRDRQRQVRRPLHRPLLRVQTRSGGTASTRSSWTARASRWRP